MELKKNPSHSSGDESRTEPQTRTADGSTAISKDDEVTKQDTNGQAVETEEFCSNSYDTGLVSVS